MPNIIQPTISRCCCICSGFLRVYVKYVATKTTPAAPDNDVSYLVAISLYWYDSSMNLLYTDNITNLNNNNNPPTVRNFAENILGLSVWDYVAPYPQPVGTTKTISWQSNSLYTAYTRKH